MSVTEEKKPAEEVKKVFISDLSRKRVNEMIAQAQAVQRNIEIYLAGVKETLGLEGDWNLDVATGELTRKEDKKQ